MNNTNIEGIKIVGGQTAIPVNILPEVRVKKIHPDAILPTKERRGDSGYDLYTLEDVTVPVGMKRKLRTGLAFEIPFGMEGQVRPRSGISADTQLDVKIGTIDSPYRGELMVTVHNTSLVDEVMVNNFLSHGDTQVDISTMKYYPEEEEHYKHGVYLIPAGTKIAQIVFQKVPEIELRETMDELSETDRGSDGYGSSGL
jgi:dUTP pyrophosphatase